MLGAQPENQLAVARRSGGKVERLATDFEAPALRPAGEQADTPSHRLFANGFLLDAAAIEWFFEHYIPSGQRSDWRFAPLLADDLDGVAPACVILAECDPLVDEGLAYADRLRAAGVAVELELYRGLTHDFIKMGRVLKEAGHALDAAAAALRKNLQP